MPEDKQTRQLGEKSIGKLLIQFSAPAIGATVINSLYNVVDRIYIGRGIGEIGIAAVTIAFPIMMIVMAVGMMIAYGTNALMSIRLGQKKKDEAEIILGQGFFVFVITSIVFTITGLIFIKPLLIFFGASDTILPYSIQYTSIIIAGILPQEISFGINNFIRAEGNPFYAMKTMFIGAILNMILDPIFIFGFKLGIKGAAYATVISMIISALWVLRFYFSGQSVLKFHFKNFRLNFKFLKLMLLLGFPPCIMHFIGSFIQALLNNRLIIYGGDMAIAIIGVVWTAVMLILMPIIGLSQGAQPILGYNFGANNYDRVKKTYLLALNVSIVICFFGWIILMIFPQYLFMLFNTNLDFIKKGSYSLRLVMCLLPLIGPIIITSNYFQAIGKPFTCLMLSLTRQVIVLIPLIYILPIYWGLTGIWLSMPFSDIAAFTAAFLFMTWEFKRLKKLNLATANYNYIRK